MWMRGAVVSACLMAGAAVAVSAGAPGGDILLFERLGPEAVTAVFSASERMVWDREGGRAVAEVPRERASLVQGLTGRSLTAEAAPTTFGEAVGRWLPEALAGERGGRFARKEPAALARPSNSPPRHAISSKAGVAEGSCFNQGFESSPIWSEEGGEWWHYEGGHSNAEGDYFWNDTACDAATGSWNAEAIMGGDYGYSLPCDSIYDYYTESWLEYAPWITCAYGAANAWLTFNFKVRCEQDYDFAFIGLSTDGYDYYGYGVSGDWGDFWYLAPLNLRSWYGIGDATSSPQLALAMVFVSDFSYNLGIGARIDDIQLSTSAPPTVSTMAKKGAPFRFVAQGTNFQPGVKVYIGGSLWTSVTYKNSGKLVIGGGAQLKAMVPKGQSTIFTFLNPDGGVGEKDFSW